MTVGVGGQLAGDLRFQRLDLGGQCKAFAPLTFTDEDIPQPADPVIPAQRSPRAAVKDAVKETPDGLPLYRYRDLLEHLETLDRQVINFAGQQIEKITAPTAVQARAFDLLGSPSRPGSRARTKPRHHDISEGKRQDRHWEDDLSSV